MLPILFTLGWYVHVCMGARMHACGGHEFLRTHRKHRTRTREGTHERTLAHPRIQPHTRTYTHILVYICMHIGIRHFIR